MKRFFIIALLFISATYCTKPPKLGNVTINGNIKGLKKGTVYLQKIEDTILVNVDSIRIDGNSLFTFNTNVKEPEVYYLYLDKNDGIQYNDRIDFFAEPGEITITTSLLDFEKDIKIVGGKNQEKYNEYKKMLRRFNNRNLRLIKEDFEASKQKDDEKLIENDKAYKKLIRQKYLYTINFALNNKKLPVAPYVALTETPDANIKYLDTIVKAMGAKAKKSMYGKQLIDHIKTRKIQESTNDKK